MRKHGFTLVEISIVVVIIGLLIGGILAGQGLIQAGKITAQVVDFQKYDSKVMAFKTKYKSLPGDAPQFGGDGDGIISQPEGCPYPHDITVFGSEMVFFWQNLFPKEFNAPTTVCNGLIMSTSGTSKSVPASKIGRPGAMIFASAISNGLDHKAEINNPANYYTFISSNQFGGCSSQHFLATSSATAPVKPDELYSLDTKMDDAMANTGNVTSGNFRVAGTCGSTGTLYNQPLTTCSSAGTYIIANDSYECTPLIRIGASSGKGQ